MKNKLLLALGSLALIGGSLTLALSSEPSALLADGESEVVSSSEIVEESSEPEAIESSEAVSEEADKTIEDYYHIATNWIEDKIIPLVGSVSIASVLGTIVAVVTAFTKAKGDKANKLLIELQNAKIVALESCVARLEQANENYQKYQNEVMEDFKVTLVETTANVDKVANYAKTTADMIASQNSHIANVEKMKNVLEVSCNLTAKSLALSEVAVKSGIAKDAQKLIATLKEENKDGQGS